MNEGDTRAFMRPYGVARPQRERTIYRGFAVPFREEMNVCELLDIGRPERPDCVHRWRIAEQGQAVDHAFPALCSKCGAQRSYSANIDDCIDEQLERRAASLRGSRAASNISLVGRRLRLHPDPVAS